MNDLSALFVSFVGVIPPKKWCQLPARISTQEHTKYEAWVFVDPTITPWKTNVQPLKALLWSPWHWGADGMQGILPHVTDLIIIHLKCFGVWCLPKLEHYFRLWNSWNSFVDSLVHKFCCILFLLFFAMLCVKEKDVALGFPWCWPHYRYQPRSKCVRPSKNPGGFLKPEPFKT